jgi:hypothetical protein
MLGMDEKMGLLERLMAGKLRQSFSGTSQNLPALRAIAGQLVQEIASVARRDPQGTIYAPDQYTLSLNPVDAEEIAQRARFAQTELSNILQESLNSVGIRLIRQPHVTLATDPTLEVNTVRVIAWHSADPLQFSKQIPEEPSGTRPPPGAFLIIEGKRHFPLTRQVIKIGRRLDNHLILEDPHVSRSHAQLEVVNGRYVIIDLGSTAGTRVNGRLIKRHSLRPGDIVSIAAVQLIYGEDPGGPPDVTPPYEVAEGRAADEGEVTPLKLKYDRKKTDKLN